MAEIIARDWTAWAADGQPVFEELTAGGRLSLESIVGCRQQAWPGETIDEESSGEAY